MSTAARSQEKRMKWRKIHTHTHTQQSNDPIMRIISKINDYYCRIRIIELQVVNSEIKKKKRINLFIKINK